MGEELKKRLQKMLDAPKDKPITIDKGHDAPIYGPPRPKKPKPT